MDVGGVNVALGQTLYVGEKSKRALITGFIQLLDLQCVGSFHFHTKNFPAGSLDFYTLDLSLISKISDMAAAAAEGAGKKGSKAGSAYKKPASSLVAKKADSKKKKAVEEAFKQALKTNKSSNSIHKKRPAGKQLKPSPEEPLKSNGTKRKIADLDALEWKEVDVTAARMGDFEGFFGLEELDGVTVNRTEDGKLEFIQKEEPVVKKLEKAGMDMEDITEEAGKIKPKRDQHQPEATPDQPNEKPNKKKSKAKKTTKEAEKPIDEAKPDEKDDLEFNPFAALDALPEVDTSILEWDDMESTVLSQPIQQGLALLKYTKPTEIQRQAIPEIMAEHDVVGKAATGSGKTLAYGIPILERHLQLSADLAAQQKDKNESGPKQWPTGLVFAPTRELAHQIVKHIAEIAKYCPIAGSGIVPLTGGLSIQKQQRLIAAKPAVVVATPGRFLELIEGNVDTLEMFKRAEVMVLDEADRILQDGHFKEMDEILDLLGRGRLSKRQTLVFSATFQKEFMSKLATKKNKREAFNASMGRLSSNEEALVTLQKKLQFKDPNPVFVDANPTEAVASKVHECIIECGNMEKDLYLYYFALMYPGRTIVFVNSIDAVKRLAPLLQELSIPAFAIHSNMVQKQRMRSLERFRANERGVLIATDVAARGLDIPMIQHVVHYHLPRTADMYVHRSGRTARAGSEGVSVLLCAANEAAPLMKLKKVLYKDNVQHNPLQPFDVLYDVVARIRDRVSIAKQITDSTKESTYKGKDDSWLHEAAADLGVDLDSDFELSDADGAGAAVPRPKGWQSLKPKKKAAEKILNKDELRVLRAQLAEMVSRPVTSRSSKYLTSGNVNLAHMVLSGNSHEAVLGHSKTSALDDVGRKKKHSKVI